MKTENKKQTEMNILEMSNVAKIFYEKTRPRNAVSGFVKYILTDGKNCLLVDKNFIIQNNNERVFRCSTINGETQIKVRLEKSGIDRIAKKEQKHIIYNGNNRAIAISIIQDLEKLNIPFKETNKGIEVQMSKDEFYKKINTNQ